VSKLGTPRVTQTPSHLNTMATKVNPETDEPETGTEGTTIRTIPVKLHIKLPDPKVTTSRVSAL